MRPHGVMFHHFHGGTHPPVQGSLSADELEAMIAHLGPQRILPAEIWAERAHRGTLAADDLCLTFDDSLRCQYDVARPVLDRHGIRAFWFVYTSVMEGELERLELYRWLRTVHYPSVDAFYGDFERAVLAADPGVAARLAGFDPASYLSAFPFYSDGDRRFRFIRDEVLGPERYVQVMDAMLEEQKIDLEAVGGQLWMEDADLRSLRRDGHVIGLHSHTHPTRLARLAPEQQEAEYRRNAEHLRAVLGEAAWCMSHPCNSYGPETLQVLRGLGIRLGFRANMEPACGPLEHPREDHARVIAQMRESRS